MNVLFFIIVFIDSVCYFDIDNNIKSSSIQQMDSEFDRMLNAVGPCTYCCLFCEHQSVSDWKRICKIFVCPPIHLYDDLRGDQMHEVMVITTLM